MGGTVGLLLLALLTGHSSGQDLGEFYCPYPEGQYRNPEDCSSYYSCSQWKAQLLVCNDKLHFNSILGNCDWPQYANCQRQGYADYSAHPAELNLGVASPGIVCPNDICHCQIPDPSDCSKFYKCIKGKAYHNHCSQALWFNPDTTVCDLQENVKCGVTTTQKPTTTTPKPTTTTPRPTKTTPRPTTTTARPISSTAASSCKRPGLYPDKNDCRRFYHCSHGIAHHKWCPSSLHFNPSLRVCDWPDRAGCQNGTGSEEPPKDPEGSCECECCILADQKDCSKFYLCLSKKLYHKSCGKGLLFNPAIENCDHPENVKCADPITTPMPTCKSEFSPHESDCGKFYHCAHGIRYPKDCPFILHWSVEKNRCESPCIAKCDPNLDCRTTTTASTPMVTTTVIPKICKDPNREFYPHESNCGKFYHCAHGIQYPKDCPSMLHWSVEKNRCEWPCIAKCDKSFQCEGGESNVTTPRPGGDSFVCPHPDGLYPDPNNCQRFFHCSHSRPHHKWCPAELHFNPTIKVCDWPDRAGCQGGVTPTDTPGEPDGNCGCECCILPDKNDCSKFFLCLNHTRYHRSCGKGLLFNPAIENCDHPENVKCADPITTPMPTCKSEFSPHESDCGKFYHCAHGIRYPKDCPFILHWSVEKNRCESPCIAKCDPNLDCRTTTTASTPMVTTTVIPKICKDPNREFYPHESNCGKFYHCAHGIQYPKDCPSMLHWSVEKNRCEWPCIAKCDKSSTCPDNGTGDDQGQCTCKECVLPDPSDCSTYYICHGGKPTTKRCPHGQLFDRPTKTCRPMQQVYCPVVGDPVLCLGPIGLFPIPGQCSQFVHCANGVAHIKRCPPGLEFDPTTRNCIWPNGKCGAVNNDKACLRPSGLFPNREDCASFYHCDHGKAYLKQCPKPLHFNRRLEVCDWPWAARCKDNDGDGNGGGNGDDNAGDNDCELTVGIVCPPCACRVPDYSSCDTFYQCTDTGDACKRQCPLGLHYNKKTNMCDLPAQAKC